MVFKLRLNQRLLALIINESVDLYYSDNDKSSKLSSRAKEIKELCKDVSNLYTFIGEFPSIHRTLHTSELVVYQDNLPYLTFRHQPQEWRKIFARKKTYLLWSQHQRFLKKPTSLTEKETSEVIPSMLSTVDRLSNPKTGHAHWYYATCCRRFYASLLYK